jgi:hypothetical protein
MPTATKQPATEMLSEFRHGLASGAALPEHGPGDSRRGAKWYSVRMEHNRI